jgi:N6-L-threonylcarbamoyladenine synthase
MKVLGIETSCDECAVAIVEDGKHILSNVVATQIALHRPFQGVVPEIASRLHTEWIAPVVQQALDEAHLSVKDVDAVAVTNRPGLLGALLVGVNFAKAFAATLDIPLIGIDHIRAHLYASQIEYPLAYPYLGLLVSGGHTVICTVHDYDRIEVMGTTIDDAIGEAFDKVSKHYGFGYPGGVIIDQMAQRGDPLAYRFPGPSLQKGDHPYDVSYSGLKTAVINQLDQFAQGSSTKKPEDIAASFQRTAVGILMKRVRKALDDTNLTRLAAGGGVAANSLLRKELKNLHGVEVAIPSMQLCTDNGAMIAALAYRYLVDGKTSSLDITASARVTAFKKSYP